MKLFRNGKLSPIDLSQMCSKRIEETRSLNAYISVINSTTDYQEKNKKELRYRIILLYFKINTLIKLSIPSMPIDLVTGC